MVLTGTMSDITCGRNWLVLSVGGICLGVLVGISMSHTFLVKGRGVHDHVL
jgi:hypothetical protein